MEETLTPQSLVPPPVDAFPKSSFCLVLLDLIYNSLGPVEPLALAETRALAGSAWGRRATGWL